MKNSNENQTTITAAGAHANAPTARWPLAALCISMLMPSLDTSIANAGLPHLAAALNAPFGSAQWIILSYLLAITTLIVSVGRLGDLFGTRRLLLFGIGLFTAASLACGAAPSLWTLVAARCFQGIGAAIMLSLTVSMVRQTVPSEKLGSSIGLLGTMSAIGTSLGPSLGGVLIAGFGWRSIFLVNVPVGVINFMLAQRFLPADREGKRAGTSFDLVGTGMLALTLAAYALALTTGSSVFDTPNLIMLAGGAVGVAAFIRVESRVGSPLLDPAMFRRPALVSGLAASSLVSTVMMASLVVGPFYLIRSLGLETLAAGVALSAGPLFAAVSGVPAGKLVDRYGARTMVLFGLAGIVAGASVIAILPASAGLVGYVLPVVLMTSGYATFQAANNTSMISSASEGQRGVISGMLSLSRNLGLMNGAAVMGAIFASVSAAAETHASTAAAASAGMRATFGAAVVLAIFAAAAVISGRIYEARSLKRWTVSSLGAANNSDAPCEA
ncbi:MAG: MFS transporter [Pyrinomonadaceae bacterium]|nr:MFS transporter [Pyrinomonadaceae bacterium]